MWTGGIKIIHPLNSSFHSVSSRIVSRQHQYLVDVEPKECVSYVASRDIIITDRHMLYTAWLPSVSGLALSNVNWDCKRFQSHHVDKGLEYSILLGLSRTIPCGDVSICSMLYKALVRASGSCWALTSKITLVDSDMGRVLWSCSACCRY